MKIVEGQLSHLEFVKTFSKLSNSFASGALRDYINSVAQAQNLFPDTVPRFVNSTPAVNQDGSMNVDFIEPFEGRGRIVTGRG